MSSKVVYMPMRDQSHVKYAAGAYILGLLMLDIHTLCAPIYLQCLSMGQKYLVCLVFGKQAHKCARALPQ